MIMCTDNISPKHVWLLVISVVYVKKVVVLAWRHASVLWREIITSAGAEKKKNWYSQMWPTTARTERMQDMQWGSASAAGEKSRRVLRFCQSCAVTAAYYTTGAAHMWSKHFQRHTNTQRELKTTRTVSSSHPNTTNICATGALTRCRS